MKKIMVAILLAIIALCVINGVFEIGSDILNGQIHILDWLVDHQLFIAIVICYIGLTYIGPFKK